jgi:KaiC/GvpD/RAD55 family RecA-like ATPase/5S rRNA maturation endonuclease (ribonuclease M5)
MDDDFNALVSALETAGCQVKGRAVVCAFHGDRSASGSIYLSKDGRHRYRCHACDAKGDAADIIALTTGRPLAEILAETNPNSRQFTKGHKHMPSPPEPQHWPDLNALEADLRKRNGAQDVYRYKDEADVLLMVVFRLEPKSFRQASPAPGGGWWLKRPEGLLPILNRPGIARAEQIILCEGEKDCRSLHALGFTATTAPMGADAATVAIEEDGKAGMADWSPLAGKTVILWGDRDQPGQRHMDRVQRVLGRLHPRPTLRRVRLDDLDGTKDAAELIEGTCSDEAARQAVQRVIDGSRLLHAASALHARMDDAFAGKLQAVPWPWASVGGLTNALLPGAMTMLVGGPGASKSFLLMQGVLWWQQHGYRVALMELEESAGYWQQRALALLAGHSGLMDPAWLASHADEARGLMAKHAYELDRFAASLNTTPPSGITLDDLATWIELQAAAGIRIVCVDPLTAAVETADKPWIAARKFMQRVNYAATTYGASMIITSHGRKGNGRTQGPPDLDSLAGGSAYARFSSTVLWLDHLAEPEGLMVTDADGRDVHAHINRKLRVLKARNGRGQGMVMGMRFSGETLRTEVTGVIVMTDCKAQAARVRSVSGRDRQHSDP